MFANISVTDNSIADWNTVPPEYVFEATCPADAVLLGLRSVKVYADAVYIYLLVEPEMSEIVDQEWVPFHVYLNTDNSDLTGGYGDEFTDANADILLEGAIFAANAPYPYNPSVFKWWGEVGSNGWDWVNWSVDHDQSDCWGALVCEGQLTDCSSQYVNGKFEIKINRSFIPATWSNTAFGIGFDIDQNWSAVGVLPIVSPTEENQNGWTQKMQITIDNGTSVNPETQMIKIDSIYYVIQENTVSVASGSTAIGDVVIPESIIVDGVLYPVVGIQNNAFMNATGITSITIPSSITTIGDYAFYNCYNINSITDYAETPQTVGANTFDGVRYNCKLYVPKAAVNTYKNDNNWGRFSTFTEAILYVIGGIYYELDPENLTAEVKPSTTKYSGDIVIPETITYDSRTYTVTSVGNNAFTECTELTSIEFPNSVTTLGEYLFFYCTNLTNITIPNPNAHLLNTDYHDGMLFYCEKLKQVVGPACLWDANDNYTGRVSYFPNALESVQVTNGELSANALWMIGLSYKTLQSIDLSGATNTELLDEVFQNCYHLQTLLLPANLTRINYMSVAECIKLPAIDIPASVTEIDDRAFEDCRSLQRVRFNGNLLRRIGNWAFYNAHQLNLLAIPEGVTEIGDGAFYGCTYLEGLLLPSTVQSVGDNCFALCSRLSKMEVNAATPPSIAAKTFYDVNRQIPVYVPDECVDAYKNDALWGEFNIRKKSEAPQAIEEVMDERQNGEWKKLFRDGQILILRGNKTYTMTGQEVK